MPTEAIIGIVILLVIVGVVFWLRSSKPADQLPEEAKKKPLPEGSGKKDSAEKKPEDKKPDGKSGTDKKAPEKKPEDKKPEEKKGPDKKPEDKKPEDKKAEEKPADKKPAAPAVAAQPAEDKKPEPPKTPEKKPEETRAAEKPSTPAVEAAPPPTPAVEEKPAARPQAEEVRPAARESIRPQKPATHKDLTALKKGLEQTRGGWVQRLVGLFAGKKEFDPELVAQIEETLLTGDVGVGTSGRLLEVVKEQLNKKDLSNPDVVWSAMREVARGVLSVPAPAFGAKAEPGKPLVVLVVGINGVGKTTTIGKLAARYKEQGKKVYLSASDTFRAAAVQQIELWGKRVGVPVVKGKDLTKPSAVVFDAVQTAAKEGADVVLADTAGRLHTKTPLMDELRKIKEAAAKALPGAPHEILLVLDSTTGQNASIQVKEFRDALDLTGIVLTKLDGTAKGGVILGICDEHKLPVRFVGVGEKVDDLREFDADDFTQALFSRPDDEAASG